MKKKIGIGFSVILILIIGFFVIKGGTASKAKQAKKVKIKEVEPQKMVTKVSADGTVRADCKREIRTTVEGRVDLLPVEEGDQLSVGEKLVQLESESLQQDLKLAKIDLKKAEQNYINLKNKYKQQQKIKDLNLAQAKYQVETSKQSLTKKKVELQEQIEDLESKLTESKIRLERLAEKLEHKKKLYQQQAITKEELKTAKENHQKQQEDVEFKQAKLERLKEEKKTTKLKLAQLKVKKAQNQVKLKEAKLPQVTKEELEKAQLKVNRKQTQLNSLQKKLHKLEINTPIKGTIVDLPIKPEDKLAKNSRVVTVAKVNDLVVEAMVDEVDISGVEKEQQVTITSEAFDQKFSGQVTKIASAATKEGNINKFKTDIKLMETTPLRPGMFVTAEITTNIRHGVIAVPQIAVFGDKDKYIYVAENGKAKKKTVELGLSNLKKVQVKGIKPGTKVIVGPFTTLKHLKAGMAVTAKRKKGKQKGGKK